MQFTKSAISSLCAVHLQRARGSIQTTNAPGEGTVVSKYFFFVCLYNIVP